MANAVISELWMPIIWLEKIMFEFCVMHHIYSSVSITTDLRAGRPWFDLRQGQGFFLLSPRPNRQLDSTNATLQWEFVALSPGVKKAGA